MFQPPMTIAKILQGIHSSQYVLPAIQREFVWSQEQIRKLFDSLMRGYPIGTFLFWKVEPAQTGKYSFYDFVTEYHEKNYPYAPVKQIAAGQGITAILDGQQRLTALNIGLYGSHAERLPRRWKNNPDAFPKKRLFLNLLNGPDVDELGMAFDFRFLTDDEAERVDGMPDNWFLVSKVLQLANSGPALFAELKERDLVGDETPFNNLYSLYHAVRETPIINAFCEESQDMNKVLGIFVRVNSGGTVLSYSDLLLSIATNQWESLDAREKVQELVKELNAISGGFNFSKDLVLKSGLVLIDLPDIRFQVGNFTQANMSLLEARWAEVRSSLIAAAELVGSFGFTERTLTADSVLIPIAYYIRHRELGKSYIEASSSAKDRLRIQQWVTKSLMKRGIWGSGLDTLLMRLRETIRQHGSQGFPAEAIEQSMSAIGKSLKFEVEELNELLDLKYGKRRTFPVLATLYPGLDLTKQFHEDHIFPRSRFTPKRLRAAGVPADRVDDFVDRADCLPNLQLLAGQPNLSKKDKLPKDWLDSDYFPTAAKRQQYVAENDLEDIPGEILGFLEFYDRRRQALESRLRQALGVNAS